MGGILTSIFNIMHLNQASSWGATVMSVDVLCWHPTYHPQADPSPPSGCHRPWCWEMKQEKLLTYHVFMNVWTDSTVLYIQALTHNSVPSFYTMQHCYAYLLGTGISVGLCYPSTPPGSYPYFYTAAGM